MRADKIADTIAATIEVAGQRGYPAPEHAPWLRDLARCLARIESAVEALAADAGSGPSRRIRAILDGNEKEGM